MSVRNQASRDDVLVGKPVTGAGTGGLSYTKKNAAPCTGCFGFVTADNRYNLLGRTVSTQGGGVGAGCCWCGFGGVWWGWVLAAWRG